MINNNMEFEPFVYPTKDERIKIQKSQPLLSQLYSLTDSSNKSYDNFSEYIKNHDLELWKNRFNNKIRKIEFSFVLTKFSYLRGIPDKVWFEGAENGTVRFLPQLEGEDARTNQFLFKYSSENFYYHFVSAADLAYHLLNVHFQLGLKSGSNFNKRVISKMNALPTLVALENFEREIKDFRRDRNDLTHNFPFNEIDLRSKQEVRYGKLVTTMGRYSYTPSEEVMIKIEDAIGYFAKLMEHLNKELN
jgi:hypothetical protein